LAKKITFAPEARQRLIEGISIPVRAIAAAYGPSGRNAIFHRPPSPPEIIADGLAIARSSQPTGPVKRQAGKLLYETLYDFDRDYGDGSSSLALLIHAIMVRSHRLLDAGLSSSHLLNGLFDAEKRIRSMIMRRSQVFDDERHSIHVCRTAASNDFEVAETIDSFSKILGPDGHINVKEGYGLTTHGTIYPGMVLPAGLISS